MCPTMRSPTALDHPYFTDSKAKAYPSLGGQAGSAPAAHSQLTFHAQSGRKRFQLLQEQNTSNGQGPALRVV